MFCSTAMLLTSLFITPVSEPPPAPLETVSFQQIGDELRESVSAQTVEMNRAMLREHKEAMDAQLRRSLANVQKAELLSLVAE
tara:strand:- start:574 stop:822 length:249 start_codon:yes stop_codon:yes gene_type:complete